MNINTANLQFTSTTTTRNRTDRIIIHHYAVLAAEPSVETIHRNHIRDRNFIGIGYNAIIEPSGDIWQGRPFNAVGAHTTGQNSTSIGIALNGNFSNAGSSPTEAQLNSLVWLVQHLRGTFGNIPVARHSDFANTNCPGRGFPWDEFVRRVNSGEPVTPAPPAPVPRPQTPESEATRLPFPGTNLRNGSRGENVRTMQRLLNAAGANPRLVEDGIFGPRTEAAVRDFQRRHGLGVDGIIGPITWARVVRESGGGGAATFPAFPGTNLRRGSRGENVRTVQRMLNARGATPRLAADGIFGPLTDAAVRRFQQQQRIGIDGIVGPATWGRLRG